MALIKCKDCCREITEHDAWQYDGYCKKCYQMAQENNKTKIKSNSNNLDSSQVNKVAIIIKFISVISCIVGIIYGISLNDSLSSEEFVIPVVISSIIISVFIFGFGEIIQLLEDIKNK